MEPLIYTDPELYDAIYGSFDDDIPFYLEYARQSAGAICELASGAGRVTIPLASAGHDVTGVDLSEQLMAVAGDRARKARVKVDWVQADMETFSRPEGFSLVIVPLHSFSHLVEPGKVAQGLQTIRDNLVPGGRLILALQKPDPAVLAREDDAVFLVGNYTFSDGKPFAVYESSRYDTVNQRLYLRWFFEFPDRTTSTRYSLRMFFPEELRCVLLSNGFETEDRFGWYDRSPLTDESGTQIIVARKKG